MIKVCVEVILKLIYHFFTKPYVACTQNNRLDEKFF